MITVSVLMFQGQENCHCKFLFCFVLRKEPFFYKGNRMAEITNSRDPGKVHCQSISEFPKTLSLVI